MSLDLRFERLIAARPEHVFDAFTDPDGGTLMTMVQAGFPTEDLRHEHTVGLPNAFDRLARRLDDHGRR